MSGIVKLHVEVREICEQVKNMAKHNEIDSNTTARGPVDSIHQGVLIKVDHLIVLDGKLN